MKTTVEALKDYYAEIGGTASDVENVNTIPDMIEAINAFVASGGASELPPVTADDNDKVLAVVNGEWAKANPPGGGNEPFVINITYSSGAYTTDKTVPEINLAVTNGIDNIIIAFHDKDAANSGTVRYFKDFSVHETSGNKVLSVCSVISISDVVIKIIWLTINQGSQVVFYRRVDYGISGGDITPTYTQIPE